MFTKRRLWLSILVIWIVSSLASIPIVISTKFISTYHRKKNAFVEICFISLKENWQLGFLFFSFIVFYSIPCVLLFILYGKIVCVIRKRNAIPDCDSLNSSQKRSSIKYDTNLQDKQLKRFSDSLELLGDLPVHREKNDFRSRSARKSISLPRVKHKQIITLLILMVMLMLLSMLPYRVSFLSIL